MLLTKLKSVMAGVPVIAVVGFGGSICWTLQAWTCKTPHRDGEKAVS